MKAAFLIGRLVFGGFFITAGINHFRQRKGTAQYAGAKHVPLPDIAVPATGALLIAGGTSILLGVKPKVGTLAVMAFLAGVSPVIHDFWKVEDPNQRENDRINFMKNLGLFGGALALLGVEEPWPASVPIGQPGPLQKIRRFAREIAA